VTLLSTLEQVVRSRVKRVFIFRRSVNVLASSLLR